MQLDCLQSWSPCSNPEAYGFVLWLIDDFVDAVKKNLPGAEMLVGTAIEPEAVTAALAR